MASLAYRFVGRAMPAGFLRASHRQERRAVPALRKCLDDLAGRPVQGIALWNRADLINLAPGAIIYVTLKVGAAEAVDPTLNADVAKFLATQVLPAAETP